MSKFDARQSRGYLNNNPGNLDRSSPPWNGEITDYHDSRLTPFQVKELKTGRFCVFASSAWGIRALAKNLFAYTDRLGMCSIEDLIKRWAPSNENNTEAYIEAVSKSAGIRRDVCVNLRDFKPLYGIVSAIIKHECGGMPYSTAEIEDGLRLAGVVKAVTITSSSTAQAATIGGAAATAAGATAIFPESTKQAVEESVATLEPVAGTSEIIDTVLMCLKVLLIVIVLGGFAWTIIERVLRAKRDAKIAAVPDDTFAFADDPDRR